MPMQTLYTFTCDRDATATQPEASAVPPVGWSKLTVQETAETPPPMGGPPMGEVKYLCPACTSAFKTFITPTTMAAKK